MSGTQTFIAQGKNLLLPYLLEQFPHFARNKVKSFLKYQSVSVNGKVTSRHDHPIQPGDKIAVQTRENASSHKEFLRSQLDIVYEDAWIVVINKPSGLLTVSTETTRTQTAIYQLNEYLNAGAARKEKKVFVVHRLDQGASGLLVFAKTHEAKCKLQDHWDEVEKRYDAIAEGTPKESAGTVISYLRESKSLKVYSTKRGDAKHSVTRYKVIKTCGAYSFLEIILETGRKHQIRVHLADIGTPIIGDDRYGAKTDPAGRLGLHACYLAFPHPVTGEKMVFRSELPDSLKRITDFKSADSAR